MYELSTWIDKNINDLSGTPLYEKYFSNSLPQNLEDTDVFFLKDINLGIDVIFDKKLFVCAIHLFSGNTVEGKRFDDQLPFNITFSFGNKEIHKLLGEPNAHGGGYDDSLFGYIDYWEKYYFKRYSLHLRYARDKSNILLVTLDTPNFEKQNLSD